ncbi:MAG: hypothetical protein ACYC1W_04270 [Gemmatimonadaceae bacterium]
MRTRIGLAALVLLLGACRDLTGVERERPESGVVLSPTYDTLHVENPVRRMVEQQSALPAPASRARISPSSAARH